MRRPRTLAQLLGTCLLSCGRAPSGAWAPAAVDAGRAEGQGAAGGGAATQEFRDGALPGTLDAAPTPEPLDAGADILELAVPDYLPAFVSVPTGTTEPRPVVVAAHGVGDRPDWQCNEWRRLVAQHAWVLCPRGIVSARWSTPGDTRWTWHGPIFMKREIDAGLVALERRFGKLVDLKGIVYGGFSYGAANGVAIVAKEASRFPYVVLTEGGGDRWTSDLAKDFVKNGGQRVLFACGQKSCVTEAAPAVEMLKRAGAEARVEYGAGEGHGYGGAVAARIRAAWRWVTVGDPRWARAVDAAGTVDAVVTVDGGVGVSR